MKRILFLLSLATMNLTLHNEDIIGLKQSLIIFADGVSKELINAR